MSNILKEAGEITSDKKMTYKWTIKNYKRVPEVVTSPMIYLGPEKPFFIALWPNGYLADGSVSLYLDSDYSRTVNLKTSFTICEVTKVLEGNLSFVGDFLSIENFMKSKDVKLASDGSLEVLMTILASDPPLHTEPKVTSSSFMSLLDEGLLSDVTFGFQDTKEVIRAHRNILAAKSSVFKLMFTQDFQEKNHGVVEIKEYDYDTMWTLIRFIYSGSVVLKDVKSALEVHSCSHYYDLKELLEIAGEYLAKKVSRDSVVAVLKEAHIRGVPQLKKACLKIMEKTKREKIKDFEDILWNRELVVEVIDHFQDSITRMMSEQISRPDAS